MCIEERVRPTADRVEQVASHSDCAFPECSGRARCCVIARAKSRHPTAWGDRPGRINDARLNQPQGWISREPAREIGKEAIVSQARIIIEKENQLTVDLRNAGISTSGNSEILRKGQGLDLRGQTGRDPAVADDHDININIALRKDRGNTGLEFIRPLAHGEHDHAVGRPHERSLLELRIEAR